MQYCEAVYQTKRFKTREVRVGDVGIGGKNPLRVQSMTTSDTRDALATAEQIMRLADVGCEIARVTVQGMKEAEACEEIKNILLKNGYRIPLVADIHFYPPAAMRVADFVDKVRINPGNFVDKRAIFKKIEYDDVSYLEEMQKIEEGFSPLVEKCKRLKRALRIGTNHGSLSDRIMNRYGDTPFGMVESALEFTRVCRKLDFHDIIFSMKASNPLIMIQAYRLLVAEMMKLGWDYPLHLGVTEAGEGEDGRVKSAVGIGSLLLDGIGDTIRVSLTEDPWHEIDPCYRLKQFFEKYEQKPPCFFNEVGRKIDHIERRSVVIPEAAPLHRDGSVLLEMGVTALLQEDFFQVLGYTKEFGRWKRTRSVPDALVIEEIPSDSVYTSVVQQLTSTGIGIVTRTENISGCLLLRDLSEISAPYSGVVRVDGRHQELWDKLLHIHPSFILFTADSSPLHEGRRFFSWLKEKNLRIPVILHFSYFCSEADLIIHAGAECGALLADGLGEGVCLKTTHTPEWVRGLSFNILQAVRMRTSKTEFISCPGCGRTLFDLQSVTKRIRTRTAHLPGVKIAIMGCIVNGPGEMADADFGYVGSKKGLIDLYVGKTRVESDIPFGEAEARLVALIQAHGRWIEPESLSLT